MSRKLEVTHLNHSYSLVACDESLTKELRAYLTFDVPGAKFSPKYKARLWNGKICLLDRSNRVYRGLVPHIQTWAKEQGYEFECNELDNEFSVTEALEFVKSLNLPDNLEPRDYQIKAFVRAIRQKRRLFLSPTSSGKSLIVYLILRYLHAKKNSKRTLIVVPTTSLVFQLSSDFRDYGFDSDAFIHKVCEGETTNTDKPIIISTWQSIFKMPRKWFEQFDSIFGDEAHLFKAKSLTYILASSINAKHRIGLTGTLDGSETHKLILEGLFGPLYKATTTKELMDSGHVADFEIKALVLKYGDSEIKAAKNFDYVEEMQFLCAHDGRNKFITNLALSMETNTLLLFQYVDHGFSLFNNIVQTNTDAKRKVFFVYGKTDVETREEIRAIVEKEANAVIVASYGTFSTGINIKNLHNVIFASPSKSRVRNLQSIGRSLRLSVGKEKATLFDIADDLRYKDKENYTFKHFLVRLKTYAEEKFKFKIYKIDLGKKTP